MSIASLTVIPDIPLRQESWQMPFVAALVERKCVVNGGSAHTAWCRLAWCRLARLWNTVHGAVAQELKGMIVTQDPAATYKASLETLIRGLATA